MNRRDHHQHAVVGDLRHVQPAVLGRNLQAETAQLGQAFHVLVGDLGSTLDDAAVHGVEEFPQFDQKRLGSGLLGVRRLGKWVYEP